MKCDFVFILETLIVWEVLQRAVKEVIGKLSNCMAPTRNISNIIATFFTSCLYNRILCNCLLFFFSNSISCILHQYTIWFNSNSFPWIELFPLNSDSQILPTTFFKLCYRVTTLALFVYHVDMQAPLMIICNDGISACMSYKGISYIWPMLI